MLATINRPVAAADSSVSTTAIESGREEKRFSGRAKALLDRLDARMDSLIGVVQGSEFFRTLMDPATDMEFVKLCMKEIYLEIFSYQPQVNEAAMVAVAKIPRIDPRTIKRLMVHECDEADHGEMALRDYMALDGDESFARSRRMSPAAFAVASLWWGLAKMEHPLAHLGALYPFEALTPRVCAPVLKMLLDREFPRTAMEFIDFHATEDIKHTNLVRFIIMDVVERYPEAEAAIESGMEYFLAVYPMPVWETAYRRAKAAWGCARPS